MCIYFFKKIFFLKFHFNLFFMLEKVCSYFFKQKNSKKKFSVLIFFTNFLICSSLLFVLVGKATTWLLFLRPPHWVFWICSSSPYSTRAIPRSSTVRCLPGAATTVGWRIVASHAVSCASSEGRLKFSEVLLMLLMAQLVILFGRKSSLSFDEIGKKQKFCAQFSPRNRRAFSWKFFRPVPGKIFSIVNFCVIFLRNSLYKRANVRRFIFREKERRRQNRPTSFSQKRENTRVTPKLLTPSSRTKTKDLFINLRLSYFKVFTVGV